MQPGLPAAAEKALVHDLDLTVRAAGLNGIPLLGNGGSVADPNTPDRCGLGGRGCRRAGGAVRRGRWVPVAGVGNAVCNSLLQPPLPAPTCRPSAACSCRPCRENNVEQVALSSMPPGLVSVTVSGFTIVDAAGTPQYALVVNGDFK